MLEDGLCIIDLIPTRLGTIERASYGQLAQAAMGLVANCVIHGAGGLALDIGINGGLNLLMTSNIPSVVCYTPSAAIKSDNCAYILDTMDTSTESQLFSRASSEEDLKLPRFLPGPGRRCKVTIDTLRTEDQSSWYEMWEAVQAMYGMCIRFGKAGKAFDRGMLEIPAVTHLRLMGRPLTMASRREQTAISQNELRSALIISLARKPESWLDQAPLMVNREPIYCVGNSPALESSLWKTKD
ncbi:MAG: hypothetical protein Q9171_003485 [Xanthocarpia ochracea]